MSDSPAPPATPANAPVRSPRPRDAEATKALLLRAATEEFAEHGFAGARIDRIAERAGANKRLLYVYFGDKQALFDAVVADQAVGVFRAAPMDDGDLVAFAAARFDYVLAHPEAGRIAAWRAFEQLAATETEIANFRSRVDAVAAAQRAGRVRADLPAIDLFAIVLRMTDSWISAPPALRAVGTTPPLSPTRLREHRAALLAAVRGVVEPHP
ncbi:TetR/AcrR family transcriptional regulator [Streptacidiphilus neutrinimicus]|uniref:TetR/AcrR family transcriptional regulator n=1 Tax=Streptacidiphilus neutrinimicus TaxID=105420 RepID=UPI0005AB590B|nr:TetR family transcriptional regulator [Streptacidiphilus neutrinimicus]